MKRTAPEAVSEPSAQKKLAASSGNRVKRVWCVRHGQAEHNVLANAEVAKCRAEGREWSLATSQALLVRDPALTELGQKQARIASTDPLICDSAFAPSGSPERAQLIVVSPLRRTLQTALGLCGATADPNFEVLANPDIQECMPVPSDTGRPLEALREEFSTGVDFSMLELCPSTWFEKPAPLDGNDEPIPEGQAALRARCARFTDWLAARPEDRVVVVAHHTFFCHLLNIDFLNCEVIEMALDLQCDRASWRVLKATSDIVPLYTQGGKAVTFCGSPPLSGTLAACLAKHGKEAAQYTAERAGLPDPVNNPPIGPTAPLSF